MFTAMVPAQTPISRDHNKKLVKIIQALLAYQQSNIFRKPIPHKALGWDDYKDIVKKPTDINYVRRQYNEGKYKFVEEVLDELQLVWDNVFMYGKREHETYDLAIKMQKNFDNLISDFLPEYFQKINRVEYFKQFEQQKPEKKATTVQKEQKNSKKIQKMEIESAKQEVKVESEISMPKKRESFNSRRAQSNTQLTIPSQNQNREIANQPHKKVVQTQNKAPQSKLRNNNPASGNVNNNQLETGLAKQTPVQTNRLKTQAQGGPKQGKVTKNEQANEKKPGEQGKQGQNLSNDGGEKLLQAQAQIPQEAQKAEIIPEAIQNQEEEENQFPPILVNLNKTPSAEQINQLTNVMNLLVEIQELDTLSKVVRILTKYEKENMVIDGEDVNFKMDLIHISTYNRIKKQLEIKIYQLQQAERVKDLSALMAKHNIKSSLLDEPDSNPMVNGLHTQHQQLTNQALNHDQIMEEAVL